MNKFKREMMASSEGLLIIEKSNLQETLKQLSEEVEYLSSRNEHLISDLRKREFFDAYQNSLIEVYLFYLNSNIPHMKIKNTNMKILVGEGEGGVLQAFKGY